MGRGPLRRQTFNTDGGITVVRDIEVVSDKDSAIEVMIERLNHYRGVLLSSSFEYPGRYTRWDVGFTDPPLVITSRGRRVSLEALNRRGEIMLALFRSSLRELPDVVDIEETSHCLALTIMAPTDRVPEEFRSRLPSVFSVIRAVKQIMANDKDPHLGLYGPFGYDLVFQFEPVALKLERDTRQRDLILYLPDEILAVDHMRGSAEIRRYDFEAHGCSTVGLARPTAPCAPPVGAPSAPPKSDLAPGEYPALVEDARQAFARGDLFEVVLGQTFSAPCPDLPGTIFKRLKAANPAPYGALMNLGDGEYLVAASPEMFVRVDGRRIETCPLSGTIRRGVDAIEDADNIRVLLNSEKDESELTMCTDVDRNDKARVCEAESVKVIGRRQIELYSRLIHTADHVEGVLRPEFDALDGFLSHTWAVTVTGAPKPWAIKYIESHERSPRRWYGGALGRYTFDGNMNTGLTLRTIRIQDGVAEIRAGATLLHDSDPEEEEAECHLKASALLTAIAYDAPEPQRATCVETVVQPTVLMVDHEDSFVHTLAVGDCKDTGLCSQTARISAQIC
ncbi:anthranilate synthase component I [Sphingobium indicum]